MNKKAGEDAKGDGSDGENEDGGQGDNEDAGDTHAAQEEEEEEEEEEGGDERDGCSDEACTSRLREVVIVCVGGGGLSLYSPPSGRGLCVGFLNWQCLILHAGVRDTSSEVTCVQG